MRWIAAISEERHEGAQLADVARRIARLEWFSSPDDLIAAIERADATPLAIIVAIRAQTRGASISLIRRVHEKCPGIPIVGRCHLSALAGQAVVEAIRAGLNAVAFAEYDDLGSVLASIIDSARDDCVRVSMREAVAALLPPPRLAILESCVSLARSSLTVRELAMQHGMHRSTLAALFRDAALLSPHNLVMWGKLLVAAQLLDEGRLSLGRISHELQLSGASALSNAFQRYAGMRPSQLVRGSALRDACAILHDRLVTVP